MLCKTGIVVSLSFVAIVVSLTILMMRSQIRAVFWHLGHGNEVVVGQGKMILPLVWWQGKGYHDNKGAYIIVLNRAAFGGLSLDSVQIVPLGTSGVGQGSIGVEMWQEDMRKKLSGSSKNSVNALVISAQTHRFYCVRDYSSSQFSTLICRAPSLPWSFVYDGSARGEREAKLLLSSFK
jgi:hypothetical protein